VLRHVRLHRPGLIDYHDAWRWQQETAAAVREGAPEALAVLQHPPVYTLGRRARAENLLVDAETLARRSAAVVQSDRGGDVTFHGPGQLVAYAILDLRARGLAPTDHVRGLEEVMLRTSDAFGLAVTRCTGRPGIWCEGSKLGFAGVRVQGGVSSHGIALNVDSDISWFDAIVPCGLAGVRVTSMARLLGRAIEVSSVESALIAAFEDVFDSTIEEARRVTDYDVRGQRVARLEPAYGR
jgi:lipoate-protein ligase B